MDTYRGITSKTDSDNDDVPDWLEELSESDAQNAASFPYQKDIVRAKNIAVDDLLYGGPGEFTEEIVRRFVLGTDETTPVSDDEKGHFVAASADYFVNRVENRGMPVVELTIDDQAPKAPLLQAFMASLERFASGSRPVDTLVIEVFAKNTAVLEEARKMRDSCDYTLKHIPRQVPSDIYDPYYLVLERITYLCEALTLSLTANTVENFFYAFKLMHSGKQLEVFQHTDDVSGDEVDTVFIDSVAYIIESLRGNVL